MADRRLARELIQQFVSEYAKQARVGTSIVDIENHPLLVEAAKVDKTCPEVLAIKAIKHAMDGNRDLAIIGILTAFHELREEMSAGFRHCEPRIIPDGGL